MCPFQLGHRLFSLPLPRKQASSKTKVQPGRKTPWLTGAQLPSHQLQQRRPIRRRLLFLAHMQLSKIANRRGGADRDRTDDFQLAKLALSQLSYGPRWLVGLDRFELSTPRLSSVCSNQLSYRPSPLQAPPDLGSTADLQRAEGYPFGPSRLDASPRKANCGLTWLLDGTLAGPPSSLERR